MPLTPEQVYYRLQNLESLTTLIQRGQVLFTQIFLEYKGATLKLNVAQKTGLKATLLTICDDIDASANKAIALGGTADPSSVTSAQDTASEALAYLSRLRQTFASALGAAQITADVNNDLSATVADEAAIKDMLATAGTIIKIWTASERPKIQAL